MKPITMVTLFFRAVGFLVQLRGIFYFCYLLCVLFLARHGIYPGSVYDFINLLYQSLGSAVAGGLLVLFSPRLARFILWGFKE